MDRDQHDNVDKLFKDSLQSFQDKPGRQIWEKIEQQLDKEKTIPYVFGWRPLRFGAATAALVLLFSLGLWIFGPRPGIRVQLHRADHKTVQRGDIFRGQGAGAAMASESGGKIRPGEAGSVTGQKPVHEVTAGRVNRQRVKPAARSEEHRVEETYIPEEQGQQTAVGQGDITRRYPDAVRLAPIPAASYPSDADTYLLLARRLNAFRKASVIHLTGPKNRWSITGYFAQELAGYNLADHDSTAPNGKEVDKKETAVFSASGGMLVGYQLKKRWLLQSGLIYSWSKSISDPTTAYAVTGNNGAIKYQFNTPAGYGFLPSSVATGDSVKTDKSSNRLHYLSIPVIASYIFRTKEFNFLAGAGFIGNILTSAKVATTVKENSGQQPESIVTLYGLRTINYGLIFKVEMQYAFRENWSLNLMATSKNAITSINTNGRYLTYPYYVGLGLGLTHSF